METACRCDGAGLARVSAVALHWAVHEDKARAILSSHKARSTGYMALYAWEDVWRIEGTSYVPTSLHADYRAPMIPVEDLGVESDADLAQGRRRRGLVELKPSALRARIESIGAPVVRLGPRLQRVRPCDLPALLDLLRAHAPKIRRSPATSRRTAPDRGG
jgi:hypothetical protein